jgi:hypothetical protein
MFTQFVNYIQKNVGTTAVTLVTVPANNQLAVNQLNCANVTSLAVTCSVTVTRSGVAIFILRNATVPAGGSLICVGESQKIVLMAGDVLQVQSSTATSIDCVVSGVLNDFNRTATVPTVVSGSNATIAVAPSATTIGEGGTVTFTVTTNLPNGSVVYWENVGTTNAQDFTDDLNQGAVAVSGGSASFTRTLRSNVAGDAGVGEGNETVVMIVGTTPRFLGGGALAASSTVTVLDNPVTDGLVMLLDAGNPSSYPGSGTTWTDLSGNGNNLTMVGSLTFSAGSFVSTANLSNYFIRNPFNHPTTAVTTEMWCRFNTGSSLDGVWSYAVSTVDNHNLVYDQSNLAIYGPTATSVPSGINVANNTWRQIVRTSDRATGEELLYIDGLLAFSTNISPGTNFISGGSLILGQEQDAVGGALDAGQALEGSYSIFRLYNRVLSAGEVQANFNASRGRFGI